MEWDLQLQTKKFYKSILKVRLVKEVLKKKICERAKTLEFDVKDKKVIRELSYH